MSENQNFDVNLAALAQQAQQNQQQQPVAPQQELPNIPTQQTIPHQYGQQAVQAQQPVQQAEVVVPQPTNQPARPVLPLMDDEHVIGENGYQGPGVVVDAATLNQPEKLPPAANDLSPDTLSSINAYMAEADEEMKVIEQIKAENEAKQAAEEEEEAEKDPEEIAKELEEKYSQAVVVIDKLGMGSVINFTEEEREKLEKVKKIRLEEVETVNVKQFKTKKNKKNNLDSILKRQPSVHTTPIIAPASGYTASLKGASTYELISLMSSTENALLDTETKWSVIHNKITQTSLGNLNFNDFLRATAAVDYNMFIYGLLCATYPDDDKLPITCANNKCGKTFDHHYSVRSLLRAEKMSDKLQQLVAKVVDGSHTEEMAKQVHGEAAVNQVKSVSLPISGYVFDVYVQSAHDLMYNSIKGLTENDEDKYNQASILSTVVKTAYIPDPDAPGEAFEYTEAMDITKIIYSLQDTDILVLTKQSELVLDDLSFDFGLMNVKCPHCGHYREEVPFDIESILFYRYQQAMNTQVE